jgi:hypothetical protein
MVARSLAIYIVSFGENLLLQHLLASLGSSVLPHHTNVTVINTNRAPLSARTSSPLPAHVRVVDTLQSSRASGYSARYYNEALVHGFDSLANPAHDVVVTLQADTTLCPGWFTWVESALDKGCELVQVGTGDQVVAYTAAGVRAVGLYDERFVGICSHEGDYFLRAALALHDKACIHDYHHGRVTGAIAEPIAANAVVFCNSPAAGAERDKAPPEAEGNPKRNYGCSADWMFEKKWRTTCKGVQQGGWSQPPYRESDCKAEGAQPRLYRPFESDVLPTAPGY